MPDAVPDARGDGPVVTVAGSRAGTAPDPARASADPVPEQAPGPTDRSPRTPSTAPPVLAVRPRYVVGLVGVAVTVLALSWFAPGLPVRTDPFWLTAQNLLRVDDPSSVVHWVLSAAYASATVAAWAAAGSVRGVHRGAWVACGALMVWVWFDHTTGIHNKVPNLRGLPVGGAHPVELTVLALFGLVGLVLVARSTWRQRVLLAVAGALYVTGSLVVGSGVVDLGLTAHRTGVCEVLGEVLGLAALVVAAGSQLRVEVTDPSAGGSGRS